MRFCRLPPALAALLLSTALLPPTAWFLWGSSGPLFGQIPMLPGGRSEAPGPQIPAPAYAPPPASNTPPAYAAPAYAPPPSRSYAETPSYAPPSRSTAPETLPAGGAGPVSPGGAGPVAPVGHNGPAYDSAASSGGNPVLRHCVVKLIDEVVVSVEEPGLIAALEIREGMTVEAGLKMGRVNDGQARMAKLVAEAEFKIAQEKATNDIEVRFAESAAKVAEYEYRASLEANRRAPNAISSVKLQELALSYEKAQRQIEQSQHNQSIFREEAEAKRVAVQAAEDDIRRRQIVAPINGEVVEVPVHLGEWIKPGDGVCKIIRLDQLAVEGFLRAADFEPGELVGRPVVVEATLAHGRRAQFAGKLTFVHPEIDARGQFRIKAEVANSLENGQFLLRPGHDVDMTIRVDAAPQPAGPLANPPATTFPR
jgi:multidrug efflux pump subunit AcrA (membrane-fusion protein)